MVGWLVVNVPATGQVWLFNVYLLPYGVCLLVGWLVVNVPATGQVWLFNVYLLPYGVCWLVGWLVVNVPATGQVWLFNVYLLLYGVCWLVGWLLTSQQLAKCGSSMCTCCHTELLVGWLLTSQQRASVSQGRICTDDFMCCHTGTEVADPTFYLAQSQYTDTGPTSPSADPITPGAWQSSHRSANFEVTGMTRLQKIPL